ncbi:YtxH domain-containing protein [Pullulanibacillus sp. KACC 23026]|uniref:YtxH domain-containing protein n=1 Tax=Pullulanibacillus sp. KACC 23026 TaxID=3028315 RepID=UPI0023AEC068|nr:YtxH domain-containing protein [Pullulanibacillus sp. KACC 23026]WEG13868.1 YtxH domain-containing protein [Pullulanibacillus sp. KACC 23026]
MGKDKNDSINLKDFMIGAFFGGIVGASCALLFAPKTGKEIRQTIGEQSISLKDKGTTLAQKAKEKSTDLAKNMSDQSSAIVSRVKEWPVVGKSTPEAEDTIEAETLREIEASQSTEEDQA